VQRAGELLREIEPAPGERTDKPRDGTDPKLTRKAAAEAAGFSERQRKIARCYLARYLGGLVTFHRAA
jgi:hypothetical protein